MCSLPLLCSLPVWSSLNFSITDFTGSLLRTVLRACGQLLAASSTSHLIVHAAQPLFHDIWGLSALLFLVTGIGATVGFLRRGEGPSALVLWAGTIPVLVVVIAVTPWMASFGINFGDALSGGFSAAVLRGSSVDVLQGYLAQPGSSSLLVMCFAIVGTLALWVELLVRNIALAVVICVVPLLMPVAVFPALRRTAWRLLETFIILVLVKPLVVLTVALGVSFAHASSPAGDATAASALLLAAFSPLLLLRLVPFAENAGVQALSGMRSHATRAVGQMSHSPWRPLGEAFLPELPDGPPEIGEDFDIPWGVGTEPMPEWPPVDDEKPPYSPDPLRHKVHTGTWDVQKDEKGLPKLVWKWDDDA